MAEAEFLAALWKKMAQAMPKALGLSEEKESQEDYLQLRYRAEVKPRGWFSRAIWRWVRYEGVEEEERWQEETLYINDPEGEGHVYTIKRTVPPSPRVSLKEEIEL